MVTLSLNIMHWPWWCLSWWWRQKCKKYSAHVSDTPVLCRHGEWAEWRDSRVGVPIPRILWMHFCTYVQSCIPEYDASDVKATIPGTLRICDCVVMQICVWNAAKAQWVHTCSYTFFASWQKIISNDWDNIKSLWYPQRLRRGETRCRLCKCNDCVLLCHMKTLCQACYWDQFGQRTRVKEFLMLWSRALEFVSWPLCAAFENLRQFGFALTQFLEINIGDSVCFYSCSLSKELAQLTLFRKSQRRRPDHRHAINIFVSTLIRILAFIAHWMVTTLLFIVLILIIVPNNYTQ